ncbi:Neural ectodermal development factor [Tyrophagus putrescentiae]|nr:Neural ectodermal development factor [Tyrophagus putrescentiae]
MNSSSRQPMFAGLATLAIFLLTTFGPHHSHSGVHCSPINSNGNVFKSSANPLPPPQPAARFSHRLGPVLSPRGFSEYFLRATRDKLPENSISSNTGAGSSTISESAEQAKVISSPSSGKKSPMLADAYLVFKSRPPVEVALMENSRYVLECEVSGSPLPRVHWERNGERVAPPTSRRASVEASWAAAVLLLIQLTLTLFPTLLTLGIKLSMIKSRLFLDCLTPAQQGEYKCVGSSEHQRVAAITTLRTVPFSSIAREEETFGGNAIDSRVKAVSEMDLARARCQERKLLGGGTPARIYEWTQTVLENIGQEVVIRCRATGSPKPAISWLANERTIELSTSGSSSDSNVDTSLPSKYAVFPSGDLLIRNATFEDMGKYTCTASNTHGTDTVDKIFFYPTEPDESSEESTA